MHLPGIIPLYFGNDPIWEQGSTISRKIEYKTGITYHTNMKSLIDGGVILVNEDNVDFKDDDHGMVLSSEPQETRKKKASNIVMTDSEQEVIVIDDSDSEEEEYDHDDIDDHKNAPSSQRTPLKSMELKQANDGNDDDQKSMKRPSNTSKNNEPLKRLVLKRLKKTNNKGGELSGPSKSS